MKILTLGKGFISDHLPYEKILNRIVPDAYSIRCMLEQRKPDVLVNCIGFTGRPNIDQCETHRAETYLANVTIPSIVAYECQKLGIHFIQLGSGCIYFGESPNAKTEQDLEGWSKKPHPRSKDDEWIRRDYGWKENDFANPKSYYSKSKYSCDLILGQLPNVTTLRLRMPISPKNDQRNFINKIAGYKQVIDIPNSVTMTDDLVRCIDWAAKGSKIGIYHVTNPEPLSAAQTMREFQKHKPDHKFEVIDEKQLDELTTAKRSNCLLNIDKLKNAGFHMSPTKEALEVCMKEYFKGIK